MVKYNKHLIKRDMQMDQKENHQIQQTFLSRDPYEKLLA